MSLEAQKRWYAETLPLAGAVVLDGGANVGELSEFFVREVGPTGRVVSVEPLDENVRALEARAAALGAGERWRVVRGALSSRAGEVVLARGASEGTPHNSVVARDPARVPAAARVTATAWTVDALCPDATVVKLDLEGHEWEVLDQCLPACPGVRAWALELHRVVGRSLAALVRALRGAGYEVLGAGRMRSDPSGRWVSAPVPAGMDWESVPVAERRPDGWEFKMLHVVARR